MHQSTEQVLSELDRLVSVLIKENRELHRQIDQLSWRAIGTPSATAQRALRSIQRRLSSAVDGATMAPRRRPATAAPVSKTRRKVTDPQLLERRRQALAKAREVRARKRASAP